MDKKPKRPRDPSQLAKMMVDIARGETSDDKPISSPSAVASGKQGGTARALSLTKEERTEISKKAAKVRWNKS